MKTIYLVRHAQSSANQKGILAGQLPGYELSEDGKLQAEELRLFFADKKIDHAISSPLIRCKQTAQIAVRGKNVRLRTSKDFIEANYGDWSGKKISTLVRKPLWKDIQNNPSTVVFPNGESMMSVFSRANLGLLNVVKSMKPKSSVIIFSHADIIKGLLTNSMGASLDCFQRVSIDPASISTIVFQNNRPTIISTNIRVSPVSKLRSVNKPGGSIH